MDAIADLRGRVWSRQIGEEAFEGGKWIDEYDESGLHWGVFNENNQLIAAARLNVGMMVGDFPDYDEIKDIPCNLPAPIGMMTRLVTDPAYQKLGISHILDEVRILKAEELGVRSIILQVPDYRCKSIEKFGFECLGEAFDETFKGKSNIRFFLYAKYC